MLVPLILDQFFVSVINLLTTAMISSSSQESVSAVSLVSPSYMMIYAIYSAISSGGTVIIAQYKGHGDASKMKKAAGQIVFATVSTALVFSFILIIFARPLITWMFADADPLIIEKATQYLIGCAISFIFLAVYMGGFAVFRGIGETKVCLRLSMIINLIHLFASFIFINGLKLDILGTALSLNLAITVVGQCIGAGDKKLARAYGKKMVWLGEASVIFSLALFLPFLRYILKLYQAPTETLGQIYILIMIAAVAMAFFWSTSNVLPSVLRAAGDVNFTSYVSLITMWVVRVGMGYVVSMVLGAGIAGVWICMGIEWAVRTVIFAWRFHKDVWLTKKTIE